MNGLHDVIVMQDAEMRDRTVAYRQSEQKLVAENSRLKSAMVQAIQMLKVPAAELVPAMGDAWTVLEQALDEQVQVTSSMVTVAVTTWEKLDEENAPVRPNERRPKYVRAMLAAIFTATANN